MARTGIIINQTADPSAGAGVAAGVGSIYLRENNDTTFGELWEKVGSGDTDWVLIYPSSGGSSTPSFLSVAKWS